MADTKVSALAELASAPADTDELYINDGGVSKKITAANLFGAVPRVLASESPSAVASVDFTLPTGYAEFEIRGWALPATDNQLLYLRFDDGAGFDAGTEYDWVADIMRLGLTDISVAGADGTSGVGISAAAPGSANTNEGCTFTARIRRAKDAAWTTVEYNGGTFVAGNSLYYTFDGYGHHKVASSIAAARLVFASGNIASGEFRLIGVP